MKILTKDTFNSGSLTIFIAAALLTIISIFSGVLRQS